MIIMRKIRLLLFIHLLLAINVFPNNHAGACVLAVDTVSLMDNVFSTLHRCHLDSAFLSDGKWQHDTLSVKISNYYAEYLNRVKTQSDLRNYLYINSEADTIFFVEKMNIFGKRNYSYGYAWSSASHVSIHEDIYEDGVFYVEQVPKYLYNVPVIIRCWDINAFLQKIWPREIKHMPFDYQVSRLIIKNGQITDCQSICVASDVLLPYMLGH